MRALDILLSSHGFGDLPGDDFLQGLRLRLFEDSLLFEEIVDARTQMLVAHRSHHAPPLDVPEGYKSVT